MSKRPNERRKSSLGYMSIRALPFIILLPLILYAIVSHKLTVSRFEDQNAAERCREISICLSTLKDKCNQLHTHMIDYAMWDETWAVAQNPDQEWLDENLTGWIPEHFGIQVVMLTDTQLQVVDSAGMNSRFRALLLKEPQLSTALKGKISKGFIRDGRDVYMISSGPVTQSSGEGPISGTLTFAKRLDSSVLTALSDTTDLGIVLYIDGSPTESAARVKAHYMPDNAVAMYHASLQSKSAYVKNSTDNKWSLTWKGLTDWNGENIGALMTVTSRAQALTNSRAALIRSLALVASCLLIALLALLQFRSATLAKHAHIDELTGLYNHRFLQEYLQAEVNRSQRYLRPLSVAMLDIDHFKHINDEYGHLVGDQALRGLSDLLSNTIRETDVVARYGGEEFVIIMPETRLPAAVAAAERVRQIVEETVFNVKASGALGRGINNLPLKFTISIGVASFPDHAHRTDELLMAADLALFAAKHASRNAVRTYDTVQDQEPVGGEGPVTIHMAMREGSLAAIRALAAAIDARDESMCGHSEKVAMCALAIGQAMRLSTEEMNMLRTAALLHDLGRIAVPDSILCKPGPLTEEERAVVMSHSVKGAEILSKAPQLAHVASLVRHHHEYYNGDGYPDGLAGNDIPLGSRIIAAADAFDAMTSGRVYRAALKARDAVKCMWESAGVQFDPEVIQVLDRLEASGKLHELLDTLQNQLDKAA